MVYFGFNLQSNSEPKSKLKSSISLRSAMWFIVASISGQIQNKNSRSLASLRSVMLIYFWFQSPLTSEQKFAISCLASLDHVFFGFNFVKFRAKIRELMPRFARPCHVAYFGLNFRPNSELELASSASVIGSGCPANRENREITGIFFRNFYYCRKI